VAVVQRVLGDRAQAEEIASDAFLRLYQQPNRAIQTSAVGFTAPPAAWASTALRAANRRRQHDPEVGERLARASAPTSPLEDLLRAERARNVRAALARLKPAQAQILTNPSRHKHRQLMLFSVHLPVPSCPAPLNR